jgi:glycosyltransferase involved in cell wall biosynthesis
MSQGAGVPDRRYRVLVIASRPVQYQAPLLRRMALRSDTELHVAYCTLRGAEAAHDPEFGGTVKWDVPLLDGYAWTQVPNRGSGEETFFGLWNPGIWKIIREGHFDGVLCYTGYLRATFWIAYAAAKFSGAAFLFGTDTTTLTPLDGRLWKRGVKRVLWPLLFRLADQVIVPSTGTVELMRSLGLPEERVTLTPYAVDNDWWLEQSARADRAAMRPSWGAAHDDTVILFCAKLQPWKRPLDLLQAFAKAKLSNTLLVYAGEGPLRGELESGAAALGVASRVRFLGFVNQTQLPAIYTASDLMVLPSSYDAFGVVVNEAMLCGCPVAVSDSVGAGRDLVEQGRTGFVFPCGDVEALSAVLQRAVTERATLPGMGSAARARMDSWSPRENIEQTIAAVRQGVARVEGRSARRSTAGDVLTNSQASVAEPSGKARTKIAK